MLTTLRKKSMFINLMLLLVAWMAFAHIGITPPPVQKTYVTACSQSKSVAQNVIKTCQNATSHFCGMLSQGFAAILLVSIAVFIKSICLLRFAIFPHVIDKPPRFA